ncbi:MAG: DUF971 domain-containing protein [Ignavibacteria bacterium]|nr:DUF971 domain-containing protein [Ignavibacteria bacterium]
MVLTKFKRNPEANSFQIEFDNGFKAELSAEKLRNNCPCAECSGEEVLLYKYAPAKQKDLTPESYQLDKAQMVGNYAIQLSWKDGHNTGLYNWDYLRDLALQNIDTHNS